MKRIHVLRRTTPVSEIDMYDQDENNYQKGHKADRARLRRWRQLKHQMV